MAWLKPFIHWGFLLIQLITVILAVRCWSKTKSLEWKIFIIVWVLTFLTETAGKIMGSFRIHNFWLYNLFDIIFYPGIVLLYADVFEKSKLKWLAIAAAAALAAWAIMYLSINGLETFNTYYSTVAGAFIIFFALAYLAKLFLDKEISTPLKNDFYYWFSTGFVIYFAFNSVMIGMYNTIIQSKVAWLHDLIFYANHLITLVLHIFLWLGFTAFFKWTK
jgi:hypothetical protein